MPSDRRSPSFIFYVSKTRISDLVSTAGCVCVMYMYQVKSMFVVCECACVHVCACVCVRACLLLAL